MSQQSACHFMPTKILLPIDFSSSSYAALEAAKDLAQHYQAELCLLHVVPMLPTSIETDFLPQATFQQIERSDAEKKLATCVAALVSEGNKASSMMETGNDVVGNIMLVIEREQIDMVVISTHGLSGWRPAVFGSIAEKVVKLVQCPLLLLHSSETTSSRAASA